ncbi:MAG: HypC/HybG/HupF family hydrogenase formation chaperone [Clostridia bacterium]|nr:HypC/HybG/HupF family hydrogenase formation chaperone [Clostridia bacterium]
MCLAIPLKLISIDGAAAVGEAAGLTRPVRVDFIKQPKIGDYVIVHAGFAIERLDAKQAEESLSAWREVADAE